MIIKFVSLFNYPIFGTYVAQDEIISSLDEQDEKGLRCSQSAHYAAGPAQAFMYSTYHRLWSDIQRIHSIKVQFGQTSITTTYATNLQPNCHQHETKLPNNNLKMPLI